jgi:methyl-accepting chemotaxis protein
MPRIPNQRKIANLLLQPSVQLQIGLYNVGLSLLFVLGLGAYAYSSLFDFTEVVATLTGADDEVQGLLRSYLNSVGMTAALAGAAFIAFNLVLSIRLTHRLVGPTIAFRRHLESLLAGDYGARTKLRNGDAFGELADDLNKLSEALAVGSMPHRKAE